MFSGLEKPEKRRKKMEIVVTDLETRAHPAGDMDKFDKEIRGLVPDLSGWCYSHVTRELRLAFDEETNDDLAALGTVEVKDQ